MSFFDEVITAADERPAFRQAPEGDYLVTITSAKKVTANSGNAGIELQFTLQENVSGQDMEGVDLSRCRLRDTLWVGEKTLETTRQILARIQPETVGKSGTDALEYLPGTEAVVTVEHETEDRQGNPLRIPRLTIKYGKYYTPAWYFANKRKAA